MTFLNKLPFLQSIRPQVRAEDPEGEKEYSVPAYTIKESPEAFGLEVFLPGVVRDALEINLSQGELVVTGRRAWKAPEGWTEIFRESSGLDARLRIDLGDAVDAEKINAELEQGVLRVTLPKAEALKPRRIDVN